MKTLRLTVDPDHLESAEAEMALEQAAEILRSGGLVALPTETVYGLGANAWDGAAIERIFAAKRRPFWDPLIVHIADLAMLDGLVLEVSENVRRLMAAFWPGPLTLLLPRTAKVPEAITAGRSLVGIRMPSHPVALALIRRAGVPIAAPSANLFGHISPTTAQHVLDDLDGRIDAVLDAGAAEHGVESTVLDPCQSPMVIYRPGAVTTVQIRGAAGAVELFAGIADLKAKPRAALPAPGFGLRHYAPKARLILLEARPEELEARLVEAAQGCCEAQPEARRGPQLGVMLPAEVSADIPGALFFVWGRWSAPEELARRLYAGLRALDEQNCTVILCPLPPDEGIGTAIRDRLRKAASSAGTE